MSGDRGVPNKQQQTFQSSSGFDLTTALEGSAADLAIHNVVGKPIEVSEFGLCFTGDTYQTGGNDLVVSLDRRVTHGSDTDREELATITVPHVHTTLTGPQAGRHYFVKFDAVQVLPGEQLIAEIKTAYGGSGPVGDFLTYFMWDFSPEPDANLEMKTEVAA